MENQSAAYIRRVKYAEEKLGMYFHFGDNAMYGKGYCEDFNLYNTDLTCMTDEEFEDAVEKMIEEKEKRDSLATRLMREYKPEQDENKIAVIVRGGCVEEILFSKLGAEAVVIDLDENRDEAMEAIGIPHASIFWHDKVPTMGPNFDGAIKSTPKAPFDIDGLKIKYYLELAEILSSVKPDTHGVLAQAIYDRNKTDTMPELIRDLIYDVKTGGSNVLQKTIGIRGIEILNFLNAHK